MTNNILKFLFCLGIVLSLSRILSSFETPMKTHRYVHNKLIRDKTEERMRAKGCTMAIRTLTAQEYLHELIKKLAEEVDEVIDAQTIQERTSEMADVLEVVHALCAAYAVDLQEVEAIRQTKKTERGGFDNAQFALYADVPEDSPAHPYFVSNADRYSEIIE